MIDRGALVLGPLRDAAYRGVHRVPLDGQAFTGRRGKDLARRYAAAVVAGDGVLEDLDEALALRAAAHKLGIEGLDVVVFEVPQEPVAGGRVLPVAPTPPAPGLVLLGHDMVEPIEPYWSPLAVAAPPWPVNAAGLIDDRATAESIARALDAQGATDDPLVVVRIWQVA